MEPCVDWSKVKLGSNCQKISNVFQRHILISRLAINWDCLRPDQLFFPLLENGPSTVLTCMWCSTLCYTFSFCRHFVLHSLSTPLGKLKNKQRAPWRICICRSSRIHRCRCWVQDIPELSTVLRHAATHGEGSSEWLTWPEVKFEFQMSQRQHAHHLFFQGAENQIPPQNPFQ